MHEVIISWEKWDNKRKLTKEFFKNNARPNTVGKIALFAENLKNW